MMPSAELAVAAIENIINITNAFLVVTAKRERKVSTNLNEADTTPTVVRRSAVI
jgi:hypothetical protein